MAVIYTIDQAPLHILLHLAVALAAIVIGAIVLFREKGAYSHRMLRKLAFG